MTENRKKNYYLFLRGCPFLISKYKHLRKLLYHCPTFSLTKLIISQINTYSFFAIFLQFCKKKEKKAQFTA